MSNIEQSAVSHGHVGPPRFHARSAAVLIVATAISLSTRPARAECPLDLASAKKIVLTDDKGKSLNVEAVSPDYVVRTETPTPPAGAVAMRYRLTLYQGLFLESSTATRDQTIQGIVNRISSDDFKRLRAFVPIKVGTHLAIDSEGIAIGFAAPAWPPPAVPPNRHNHLEWSAIGEETVDLGPCRYRTLTLETTSTNGDGSINIATTTKYAPDLKTSLYYKSVVKNPGKPDQANERTFVSIAVEK